MDHNFRVRYNPQVYLDIQSAVDFYTEQSKSPELGQRFVKSVENAFITLGKSALLFQIRYDLIRLLPIPPFPFRAHYWVDKENNTVFVEAIFHTRENPEKWRVRIEK